VARDQKVQAAGIDPETVEAPGPEAAAEAPQAPAPEEKNATRNEPTSAPEAVAEVVDNEGIAEHTSRCEYECEEAGQDVPAPAPVPGTTQDLLSEAPPPPQAMTLEQQIRELEARAAAWDAELAASAPAPPAVGAVQETVRGGARRPSGARPQRS